MVEMNIIYAIVTIFPLIAVVIAKPLLQVITEVAALVLSNVTGS